MADKTKDMSGYEVCDRICKLNDCINSLVILRNRENVHGMDNGLLQEETQELIRAMHDEMRAFEDAIRKEEREKTANRIASFVTASGYQHVSKEEILSLVSHR